MQLTILGTSAMVPTKTRNQTAVFLRHRQEGILVDCGEGTQRQFQLAGIPLTRITRLFITHWHGDHTQGLPGIIQSLGANEYKKTLHLYGPPGSKKRLEAIKQAFVFELKIIIEVHEVREGVVMETEELEIEAVKLNHSVATYGYRMREKDRRKINTVMLKKEKIPSGPHLKPLSKGKESVYKGKKLGVKKFTEVVKGKVVSFIWDTGYDKQAQKLAKGADVLVTEATFCSDLEDKARKYRHLTAEQAGKLAKNAEKLILVHVSPRYKDIKKVREEAKKVCSNVIAPKDLDTISL